MPESRIPPLRGPVLAMHGMASSEHPLVTQTGVDVLRRGGNAFDAALAMSAVLPVVKPAANHLGGDAYVLAHHAGTGAVTAICSGGKAPADATLERYPAGVRNHGGAAVAVPGLVDAWQVFRDRNWCTMPVRDIFAPAIGYARDGFPVSRELSLSLGTTRNLTKKYIGMAEAYYIDGEPPRMGALLRQPKLAGTLEAIATGGRAAFYESDMAQRIAATVQAHGGFMTADDLKGHRADVLDPLSVDYRGYTVFETPPNSQGLILLEELKIVEGFDLARMGHLSPDAVHHLVEAKKLAFEDRQRFAGDRAFTDFDPRTLLTGEHAAARRREIDPARARRSPIPAGATDTTSFVAVDGAGNACSFIQSLYAAWGSALCVDGIMLNNRMTGFSLDAGHPNVLAPGKRTMHTLNAYLVLRDGRLRYAGNTPGGDYQVQTNLQMLTGALDFGLDPQSAVDAPRWGDTPEALRLEEGIARETADDLARRGHTIAWLPRNGSPTGRAQLIAIDPESGALIGGSDTRSEGAAAGW